MDKEEENIIEKFNRTDLDVTYTKWKRGNNKIMVLPPLRFNDKLSAIQIINGIETKVDFKLFEFENMIIFHELLSDLKYGFDITDINLDKIYFVVHPSAKCEIWKRIPLESTND